MPRLPILAILFTTANLAAQSQTPPIMPPDHPLGHGIDQVDAAPLGGAIAIPLPERERKKLAKYDIPELVGSRQAVGSQLIDGRLRRPLVDYNVTTTAVYQRLSIFEGGLVVVEVRGSGGAIRKKLLIPDDALHNYLHAITPAALSSVRAEELSKPREMRHALLRAYDGEKFVERQFDPMATMPKALSDQIVPIQDLLRAVYQDRGVSNSVAGYMPKAGDQLVGDDKKVYTVVRVMNQKVVELRCLSQPTTIYVDVKDLYNYFIGTPGAASR
ncbi:MAG: hypothetical protein QOE82_2336 [Thermoanaerobaculia bacterium]|jgi:hypothetical protein|nr:hypothetical protein [Thermoanaerobaculia bacterium]